MTLTDEENYMKIGSRVSSVSNMKITMVIKEIYENSTALCIWTDLKTNEQKSDIYDLDLLEERRPISFNTRVCK